MNEMKLKISAKCLSFGRDFLLERNQYSREAIKKELRHELHSSFGKTYAFSSIASL